MDKQLLIREAVIDDSQLIVDYIKKLAIYEKMEDDAVATAEQIRKTVFEQKYAHVLIAECDNQPIGFVLYFFNYSTFAGSPGLYLEDLFLDEAYRGYGFGKQLMKKLARIALENGCSRFEWTCLDWNEPSLAFYRKIGAVAMDEWTVQRLDGEALRNLAE
ncbi:GNAT family N-acetyltransferase [Culicoidibacter larvae]|uniref:GNAT family N-acetyltransferase n=1 Tax=Culicoidibacter larvae TaxID=2579976 RepID=A0A5R8QCC3_9FIRM|nr:GNAT family N-acetyltransferase [Culicoidibacter larvae]TLG74221.1 GNAT family N-acetyltransferase [Culicoidibacter larvae]